MSELWRCDVCHELIDPVEGHERTVLEVRLNPTECPDAVESLDLCEGCSPESLGAHMDWMTHQMEDY